MALLEVVLALAVFFGVAVTILGGLGVCMRSATQVREEAQAADLAVTVLSSVQMGMLDAVDAGPTPFEDPFADWTWQTAVVPVEAAVAGLEMTQVQVIVMNTLDGYQYRIYELLPNEEDTTGAQAADTGDSAMGAAATGGTSSGDLPAGTFPSRGGSSGTTGSGGRSGRGSGGGAGGGP